MPALISAFLVAFTLSFDEFAIASFLAGTQQTWPVYLFAQLRVPSLLPQLIAVSSVVFIASMLLVLSAEIGRRLAERRYGSEYTARPGLTALRAGAGTLRCPWRCPPRSPSSARPGSRTGA